MGRPKKPLTTLNEQEKKEYRKLTDYLQAVYLERVGYEPPWALFMTQIKDIKKNYNIGYIDILHILQYMNQIENIDITDKDTLGLVPYFINKTQNYIDEYRQSKENIKNFVFDEKVIVVTNNVNAPKLKRKNETFD
jgi:hypothetical protein